MRRWDMLAENYLKICEAQGLSSATINGRLRELERWGCWLKRRKPKPKIETIGTEEIIAYIKVRTHFHSKATVYGVISKMRGFGEFLVGEGFWANNPLRWIKGPKLNNRMKLPRRIGKEHLKKIWIEATKLRNEYQRTLWFLVLSIIYSTGIRRGELERIKLNHWDREKCFLKIDGRKTGRERHIPLPAITGQCLESYLPIRHNLLCKLNQSGKDALLLSQQGSPLTGARIGVMMHRLSRRAKVPLVSMHQFRHTCASDLLEEGVSLPEVQHVLGHASISSTYRYTHISDPERSKAMEVHPINKILQSLIKEGE